LYPVLKALELKIGYNAFKFCFQFQRAPLQFGQLLHQLQLLFHALHCPLCVGR